MVFSVFHFSIKIHIFVCFFVQFVTTHFSLFQFYVVIYTVIFCVYCKVTVMPRITAPLTASKVLSSKPKDKLYKLTDGGGLALWVYPSGNKSWKLDYTRHDKKRDSITLGSFPTFSLFEAREWRDVQKARLAKGENIKVSDVADKYHLSSVVADYLSKWGPTVTPQYHTQVRNGFDRYIMPHIGHLDVREIEPVDVVRALRSMESKGVLSLLRKIQANLKLVFDYAVGAGLCKYNPVASIGPMTFKKHEPSHFAALKFEDLPRLVEWLDTSQIDKISQLAIYWGILSMTRPSEYTGARIDEIDIEARTWTIDKNRTKRRRQKNRPDHVVYLSDELISIYNEALQFNGGSEFLFAKPGNKEGHINRASPRQSIRDAGFDSTAHGLRATARTAARESGLFERDTMEMALSHSVGTITERAYSRSDLFVERAELMEWWGKEVFKHRIV
ncbi:MAG: integrase arm-type DNA-binding domain-containing protein [Neisseriaceae bacterium]|nr:integrase arm-type DNA-binding domain-containing protein [Neisseriaceae bacterium]